MTEQKLKIQKVRANQRRVVQKLEAKMKDEQKQKYQLDDRTKDEEQDANSLDEIKNLTKTIADLERASTRKQFTIMAKDRDVQRLNKIIRELSKDLESTKASLKKNQMLMQTKQEKFEQQLSTSNEV